MLFKEFKKELKNFGYTAQYLHFTNYEDYISVFKHAKHPTMDGVDMNNQPIVEIADVSPIRVGHFTIQHRLNSMLIKLISKFANTDLGERD